MPQSYGGGNRLATRIPSRTRQEASRSDRPASSPSSPASPTSHEPASPEGFWLAASSVAARRHERGSRRRRRDSRPRRRRIPAPGRRSIQHRSAEAHSVRARCAVGAAGVEVSARISARHDGRVDRRIEVVAEFALDHDRSKAIHALNGVRRATGIWGRRKHAEPLFARVGTKSDEAHDGISGVAPDGIPVEACAVLLASAYIDRRLR
jgi:hypothetical protein